MKKMSKLPVGIQVYGLRDLLENTPENFETVMKQVKAMGYDGVELAGLYGLDPAYVRDTLAKIGLVPISAHVPLVDMMADMDKVVADYSVVGVKYLLCDFRGFKFNEAISQCGLCVLVSDYFHTLYLIAVMKKVLRYKVLIHPVLYLS